MEKNIQKQNIEKQNIEIKGTSNFYSGLVAGIFSSIICNPFDVIRTNQQIKNNVNISNNSYIQNVKFLYRSLPISLLCIPSFWSLYFGTYSNLKCYNTNKYTSLLNGYIASCISSTITGPLWFIRLKIQSGTFTSIFNSSNSSNRTNSSIKLSVYNFYKRKGITPFYTGLKATYIINASFIVQMPLYEYIKREFFIYKYNNFIYPTQLNNKDIFLITSFSKIVASIIFYPFDTIRTYCRNYNTNFVTAVKYLNTSPLNFYRGLPVYLIRSVPYHSTTFCIYEYFNK